VLYDTSIQRTTMAISPLRVMRSLVIGAAMLAWGAEAFAQSAPVELTIATSPMASSTLSLGVTHTEFTADDPSPSGPVLAARKILSAAAQFQNQHIVGFGAGQTEPQPGVYDWSRLDRRMALIRATGGVPVLTLCCTPDWMTGRGARDPDHPMQVAPDPQHFGDYANLAAQVARRYPDVKFFQVWNEFKGFWSREQRGWDYVGYTNFYNQVYDAVKRVSPGAKIGGPYVVVGLMEGREGRRGSASPIRGPYGIVDERSLDIVQYWLAHKHGADFLTIDGRSYKTRPGDPTQAFDDTQYYADVDRWLRAHTDLPIWWAEWYSADDTMSDTLQNALEATTLMRMAPTVSVALRWKPEGEASDGPSGDKESLWSDTRRPDGGKPFPFAATSTRFRECFPPGAPLFDVRANPPRVAEALASDRCVMIVNQRAAPVAVAVQGRLLTLQPYEVAFMNRK
jgi:hypothetical protein